MKLALLSVAVGCLLSACGSAFTQSVDSVGAQVGATYDPATGAYGGNVGTTIHFRDRKDAKTVKPLSV